MTEHSAKARPGADARRRGLAVGPLHLIVAAAAIVVLTAGVGWARQIGDKPPLLNGFERVKHMLVASGLDSVAAAAVFICTSMEKGGGNDVTLAVEWWSGTSFENDVAAGEGVIVLTPGDTRILATHNTAFFQSETLIPNATGATRGSARILATSKKIVCQAYSVDKDGNPPSFLTSVPLHVKGKQK